MKVQLHTYFLQANNSSFPQIFLWNFLLFQVWLFGFFQVSSYFLLLSFCIIILFFIWSVHICNDQLGKNITWLKINLISPLLQTFVKVTKHIFFLKKYSISFYRNNKERSEWYTTAVYKDNERRVVIYVEIQETLGSLSVVFGFWTSRQKLRVLFRGRYFLLYLVFMSLR